MWRLKLRIPVGKQFFGNIAYKHEVDLSGYPLSYYKENDDIYCIFAGIIMGTPKNKKAFIKDLKSRKEVLHFESEGDFAITTVKQPSLSQPYFNPRIIRPMQSVILGKGIHIWDLASFYREDLEKVLDFAVKGLNAEIISFRNEKLRNISFAKMLPELTEKQKQALHIALDQGYYDYPKRVKMEILAKKLGLSYSTFQAHLKKAEGKILKGSVKDF